MQVIHLFWVLLSLLHSEHCLRLHLSSTGFSVSGGVTSNIVFGIVEDGIIILVLFILEVGIDIEGDTSFGSSLYWIQFSSLSVMVNCLTNIPESQLDWSNTEYSPSVVEGITEKE